MASALGLAAHEVLGRGNGLVVNRLHALLGQRTGVLNLLLADAPKSGVLLVASSSVAHERMTPRGPIAP